MAVDTAGKRYSILNLRSPIRKPLFIPSGSVSVTDQVHLLNLYSGISLASPAIIITVSLRHMTAILYFLGRTHMRVKSGTITKTKAFGAVDPVDLETAVTGLSGFSVYRQRNGGTVTAMTTPTVTESDSTNAPGVYNLLLDEDMTITANSISEEILFYVSHASMAPQIITIELYAPENYVIGTTSVNTDMAAIISETRLSELDAGTSGKMANQMDVVQTDTTTDIPALINALNNLSAAQVNAEVDTAFNTAIPGSPTANSVNERLATLDDDWQNGGRLDLIQDIIAQDTTTDIPAKIDGILTTQMTESYANDGVAPTLAQAIFMIQQAFSEFSISGSTITVKKLNGSSTAATFTMDSSTQPLSRTRAS